MTSQALLLRRRSRLNVGMADEALRTGFRGFAFVLYPEALRMERRFHIARVAARSRPALIVDMAGLAVRHFELRGHVLRSVVTLHAIDHLRQVQIRQTG